MSDVSPCPTVPSEFDDAPPMPGGCWLIPVGASHAPEVASAPLQPGSLDAITPTRGLDSSDSARQQPLYWCRALLSDDFPRPDAPTINR